MKDVEDLIRALYPKRRGETTVEDYKETIRSVYEDAANLDMARTPEFYFLLRVSEELEKQGVDHEYRDPLLRDMEVRLTGLGRDYEPHKGWLDEMAVRLVTVAQKIIAAMQPEFRDEVIIGQFSKLGVVLP